MSERRSVESAIIDLGAQGPVTAFISGRSTFATRICNRCFTRNGGGDTFCKVCGECLPDLVSELESGATRRLTPPTGSARLVLYERSGRQTAIALEKDLALVGRSSPLDKVFPDVDLASFDPANFVSRRHAFILRRRGGFVVEDLESVNGTFINSAQRLAPHVVCQLKDGDVITFGQTRCRLETETG